MTANTIAFTVSITVRRGNAIYLIPLTTTSPGGVTAANHGAIGLYAPPGAAGARVIGQGTISGGRRPWRDRRRRSFGDRPGPSTASAE